MNKKSNQMISSSVRALFFVFVLLIALLSPHAAAEIIPTGWYWPTTSNHKENTQTPWPVGKEGQAAAQNQHPASKCPVGYIRFSGPAL